MVKMAGNGGCGKRFRVGNNSSASFLFLKIMNQDELIQQDVTF